jgi:hypothetical protein
MMPSQGAIEVANELIDDILAETAVRGAPCLRDDLSDHRDWVALKIAEALDDAADGRPLRTDADAVVLKLSSDTKGVFYDLRNQLEAGGGIALDRKPDESEQRYAPPPEEAPPVNKHPAQPVIVDDDGVHRFKKNKIVCHLLDNGPLDMNKLAMMDFSDEDREQFAQLIGYSVSGASELEYVSDAVIDEAMRQSKMLTRMKKES